MIDNFVELLGVADSDIFKEEQNFDKDLCKNYHIKKEFENRVEYYDKDGELHREGGPAIVYNSGTKKWYKHGEQHREDGPAVIWVNGTKVWYKHGKHHREGGPAIIKSSGTKKWYKHGKRHREDGPAVICSNGSKYWYKYGERHREDGPAVICSNGSKVYYLDGKEVPKEKVMGDEKGYDYKEEDEFGNVRYYDEDGNLHREDGPAIIESIGTKEWYRHGQLHREDGPAIVWNDGTKMWYRHGQLHREDGPAVVSNDGTKEYYLEGERVSKEEVMGGEKGYDHKEENEFGTVRYYDENGEIHREDGPAVIWVNGTKVWYKHGKRHREDGPAIVYDDGSKQWYKHGKRHREDGPAIVFHDGTKEYYLEGEKVSNENKCSNNKIYIYSKHGEKFLPKKGTKYSACFDIKTPDDIILPPGCKTVISTGLFMDMTKIDMKNPFAMVLPRSSTGIDYDVSLVNTVGIIDQDYNGKDDEVKIFLKRDGQKKNYLDRCTVSIPISDWIDVNEYASKKELLSTVLNNYKNRNIKNYISHDKDNDIENIHDKEIIIDRDSAKYIESYNCFHVCVSILEDVEKNQGHKIFEKGDRFAQFVVLDAKNMFVEKLSSKDELDSTSRGGFGSTS